MIAFVPHNCKHCGGPVVKRGNEANTSVNARQFCTRQCAGQSRTKTYVPVNCKVCGIELIKARCPSYEEYAARKVCNSESCKSAWKSRRRMLLQPSQPLIGLAMMGWKYDPLTKGV